MALNNDADAAAQALAQDLSLKQILARRSLDAPTRTVHLWARDGHGARCRARALLAVSAPGSVSELLHFARSPHHVTATWVHALANCEACRAAPVTESTPRRRELGAADSTLPLFGGTP